MTTEANLQKEIWKPIDGFEGFYAISSLGRVKSLKRITNHGHCRSERILKSGFDKDKYLIISLRKNGGKKTFKIHRLVAIAFLHNTNNKPQVNHINGIKDDNRAVNLEWVTPSENLIHAHTTGLKKPTCHGQPKGEKNGRSKLTPSDVLYIRANHKTVSRKELSSRFNVGSSQLSDIITRKNWKHI